MLGSWAGAIGPHPVHALDLQSLRGRFRRRRPPRSGARSPTGSLRPPTTSRIPAGSAASRGASRSRCPAVSTSRCRRRRRCGRWRSGASAACGAPAGGVWPASSARPPPVAAGGRERTGVSRQPQLHRAAALQSGRLLCARRRPSRRPAGRPRGRSRAAWPTSPRIVAHRPPGVAATPRASAVSTPAVWMASSAV